MLSCRTVTKAKLPGRRTELDFFFFNCPWAFFSLDYEVYGSQSINFRLRQHQHAKTVDFTSSWFSGIHLNILRRFWFQWWSDYRISNGLGVNWPGCGDLWRAKLPKVAAEGGFDLHPLPLAAFVATPLEAKYTSRAIEVPSMSRDGSSVGDAHSPCFFEVGLVWLPPLLH